MRKIEEFKRNVARGQIFRITRIALNYEMSDMADLLGISKSYISLIENAKRNVNSNVLNKYLECFAVDCQTFNKVENEVLEILFSEEVEMIRVAYYVVGMLRASKKYVA